MGVERESMLPAAQNHSGRVRHKGVGAQSCDENV